MRFMQVKDGLNLNTDPSILRYVQMNLRNSKKKLISQCVNSAIFLPLLFLREINFGHIKALKTATMTI